MAAKKRTINATEDQVQQAVVAIFQRCKRSGVELISINNNPMRRYLSRFHSMGGRKGVSDLLFVRRFAGFDSSCEVFWLELKTEIGRPSPEQIDFQNSMIDVGCYAAVAKGVDHAIKILKAWELITGVCA